MLHYRDSKITRFLLILFFILVVAYACFEASGFLFGPSISVPAGTTEVHQQLVHIKGSTARISSLSLNGKEVAVTESGGFDEPYLLAPGVNRIVLDASDKYGRTRQQVLNIVYIPDATSTVDTASATTSESESTTPLAQ